MTLRTLEYWRAHGSPYRLARPLAALRSTLRGYGYTVYHYPNDAHLTADPPQDHTPFSATGWPIESPFGVGFADDIMPPATGSGLPTIAQLAEQILLDKAAGLPELVWLKYMNSTDAAGDCWQDSWKPTHARRTSSDEGHIHLSGRSDCADSAAGDTYDPVARYRARKEQDMLKLIRLIGAPEPRKVYSTDGHAYRWVRSGTHLKALQAAGLAATTILDVADLSAFGRDDDAPREVTLDAEQLPEIARQTAALITVPGATVTPEAVAEALAGVTISTVIAPRA